jgi:alpha/beta superfamily hydrolase
VVIWVVMITGPQRSNVPADVKILLIGLTIFLALLGVTAILAAILLRQGKPMGRVLAWPIAIVCLPGVPLYTLVGLGLIRYLTSREMRSYLAGDEADDEDRPRARIHRRKQAAGTNTVAIVGGSVAALIIVGVGGFLVWYVANLPPEKPRPAPPLVPVAQQQPPPVDVAPPIAEADLKRFSPDGTFSVLMPDNAVAQPERDGLRAWVVDRLGVSLLVACFDEPGLMDKSPEDFEDFMNGCRQAMLAANQVDLVKEEKITLEGGHRGRQIEGNAIDGHVSKMRVYVVGERVYQLVAGGGRSWADGPVVAKFLDSLEAKLRPALSLVEARQGFKTKLVQRGSAKQPVPKPPPSLFQVVRYAAPAGKLAAYLTPDPKDGKKRPAIIWITGGDCNSIDEGCWEEGPPSNDQSASAFRKASIVMMFPSLRGGNNNPGIKEGFLGEVDDVLAAADFLARQEHVDAERIYLGGHSTGGTVALLVAECSGRFRAVFSFGPTDNVAGYGRDFLPFDFANVREVELRSPGKWLASIKTPTFVFEGTDKGNIAALRTMARSTKNPQVHFRPVRGATHFSTLAPINRVLADKILRDTGPQCNLAFTDEEVAQLFPN